MSAVYKHKPFDYLPAPNWYQTVSGLIAGLTVGGQGEGKSTCVFQARSANCKFGLFINLL